MSTYVPAHYRTQIDEIIREGIRKAEQHYGITLEFPSIIYKKRGHTAGTGSYVKWVIDLNPVLLVKEGLNFIKRTPIHELAHLITNRVYPEVHVTDVVYRRGQLRRTKREVHGPRWQEVMRVIGATDITRCHSYDTSHLKRKHVTKYPYSCLCKIWELGPKRHKKSQLAVQRGLSGAYRCPTCRNSLVLVGSVDYTKAGIAVTKQHNDETAGIQREMRIKAQQRTSSIFKSKLDKCRHIMKYSRGKTRAQLIEEMVTEAACTAAGAATYYAKLKNELIG